MSENFPASTSKICWFNLSSLFTSTSPPSSQQESQSPTSSPVRRRTSPRFAGLGKNEETKGQNHCCLSSTEGGTCRCAANLKTSKKLAKSVVDGEDNCEELKCICKASTGTSDEQHVYCQGHCHLSDDKEGKRETTHGLSLNEAPHYLTFNPYITGGYRNNLAPVDCIKSLFWWTNETLNIWSHLLGWVVFFSLTIHDILGFTNLPKTQPWDQAIFSLLLVCFQACMILSAAYHVFCCCSEQSYRQWLTADLLGVSLSLLAIYISGIYYAFSCVPFWLNFYESTVAAIFVCCLTCTFLRSSDGFSNRLLLFGGWACYGIVPTVHWAILHGGMSSPAVALLLPRIFWMYAISAAAFFFYVSKLPERWKPGLVNYIGSSHQIWHVLIVAALYHWHNTGLLYLNYRSEHPCSEEYAKLYNIPEPLQQVNP